MTAQPDPAVISRLRREIAIACDPSGLITWADQRASLVCGAQPGMPFERLLSAGMESKARDLLSQALAGEVEGWTLALGRESGPVVLSFRGAPIDGGALLIGAPLADQEVAVEELSATVARFAALQRESEHRAHDAQQHEEELGTLIQQLRAERTQLEVALDLMPSGVIVAQSPTGEVLLANQQAERILGQSLISGVLHEPPGAGLELESADPRPEYSPLWRSLTAGEETSDLELAIERPDGWGVLRVSSRPVRDQAGEIVAGVLVFTDVTEQKQAEQRLRVTEQRYQVLLSNASEILGIVSRDHRLLYISPSVEDVMGWQPEELLEKDVFAYLHPDDVSRAERDFATLLQRPGDEMRSEYRYRGKDGSWHYVDQISTNLIDSPGVDGIVVNARDVTERKLLEERLIHQAFHDPLTGLANRTLFQDRLAHALARGERQPIGQVALLFLDLDNFKEINDQLGHTVGDALLVSVAGRIQTSIRSVDTAARFGGDEFVVLLDNVSGEVDAGRVAQRILDSVGSTYAIGGHELMVTASVGVALSGTSKNLLRDSDTALYQAKQAGKARYAVFQPSPFET